MSIVTVYQLLLSWLPVWVQVVVLGLISFLAVILVVKLVGFILNAIPFL